MVKFHERVGRLHSGWRQKYIYVENHRGSNFEMSESAEFRYGVTKAFEDLPNAVLVGEAIEKDARLIDKVLLRMRHRQCFKPREPV